MEDLRGWMTSLAVTGILMRRCWWSWGPRGSRMKESRATAGITTGACSGLMVDGGPAWSAAPRVRRDQLREGKVHVNDFVEKRRKDRGGARATIASRGREQGGGSGKEDHVFEDKCTRGRKGKGTTHHRDVQGQDGDPDASWVLVSP